MVKFQGSCTTEVGNRRLSTRIRTRQEFGEGSTLQKKKGSNAPSLHSDDFFFLVGGGGKKCLHYFEKDVPF